MADDERLPAPPSTISTSHQRHEDAASCEALPSTSNEVSVVLSMADEERPPALPSSSSTSHQRHEDAASSEPLPSTSNEDIKERIASSAPKTYTEEWIRFCSRLNDFTERKYSEEIFSRFLRRTEEKDPEERKPILAELYHDPEEWKRFLAEVNYTEKTYRNIGKAIFPMGMKLYFYKLTGKPLLES